MKEKFKIYYKKFMEFTNKHRKPILISYVVVVLALFIFNFVMLALLNVVPAKYLIPLVIVSILFLTLVVFVEVSSIVSENNKRVVRVIAFFLAVVLIISGVYLKRSYDFLNNIGGNYKTDSISVLVLDDSPYQELEDVQDEEFWTVNTQNIQTISVIELIEKDLDKAIIIKQAEDFESLLNMLYSGEAEVIIFNESYRATLEETHPNFDLETRVIKNYELETVLEENTKAVNVTHQPFTVYVSGIDTYGVISNTSRSDVNMLVTIHPHTKTVLLTVVPRDSLLNLGCETGAEDKLTHAGIYGVDCSIKTLENAFNVDINYYMRVNFSSMENLVNAIGGVTVVSETSFRSQDGYRYYEGENEMNGAQALSFARDRNHQPGGDLGRGVNQMKVMSAIIGKLSSSAVITNFMSILDAVEGNFETNLQTSDITKFAKMQINDLATWTVIQNAVPGTTGTGKVYSGGYASVVFLNTQAMEYATSLINQVLEGTLTSEPEPVEFDYEPPRSVTPPVSTPPVTTPPATPPIEEVPVEENPVEEEPEEIPEELPEEPDPQTPPEGEETP